MRRVETQAPAAALTLRNVALAAAALIVAAIISLVNGTMHHIAYVAVDLIASQYDACHHAGTSNRPYQHSAPHP